MSKSKIQWTDRTVNPIHLIRSDGSHGGHWCRKFSPGCANCYAEGVNSNKFFKFASLLPYTGKAPKNLIFDEKVMRELLHLKKPEKVFVESMSDIFGDWVNDEWLDRLFAYITLSKHLNFQILTKRAEWMHDYFRSAKQRIRRAVVDLGRELGLPEEDYEAYETCEFEWPLENLWLGVSVENQETADERIPFLLKTPAKIRFLSCEPLLGSLNLKKYFAASGGIHWVICGGESGDKNEIRPCRIEWLIGIVEQCEFANVAVFVKQLGAKVFGGYENYIEGVSSIKLNDRKGGDINEFPEKLKRQEFPVTAIGRT